MIVKNMLTEELEEKKRRIEREMERLEGDKKKIEEEIDHRVALRIVAELEIEGWS